MDSTSIVDKVYLALELTKIRYNGLLNADTTDIDTDSNIINTFLYYVEELTQINLDKIKNIKTLEKELEATKIEYSMLNSMFEERVTDNVQKKHEKALQMLEISKKDMEPYVYKALKDNLSGSD